MASSLTIGIVTSGRGKHCSDAKRIYRLDPDGHTVPGVRDDPFRQGKTLSFQERDKSTGGMGGNVLHIYLPNQRRDFGRRRQISYDDNKAEREREEEIPSHLISSYLLRPRPKHPLSRHEPSGGRLHHIDPRVLLAPAD